MAMGVDPGTRKSTGSSAARAICTRSPGGLEGLIDQRCPGAVRLPLVVDDRARDELEIFAATGIMIIGELLRVSRQRPWSLRDTHWLDPGRSIWLSFSLYVGEKRDRSG
jgi:hypothetical protein